MVSVPLGESDWRRSLSDEPEIPIHNRYFEENPTNLEEQVALLSRPSMKRYLSVGEGPIRATYSQPGSFNDALFVVSYDVLYRVDIDETVTSIGGGIFGSSLRANPSMAATSRIGATPEYLFIADGRILWVYDGSTITQVAVPDDLGIVSVGYIAGFVICVCAQGQGVNGRFFWIEPGETTINPLNFATAERAPDPLISVRVIGDKFWLLGTNSTEVWYPTGGVDPPFARTQGIVFDRGVWEGSDQAIKDTAVVTDQDGIVYAITGNGPQRISNNSIEERIRRAIQEQKRHL
jgi:hypothetical protein